MLVITNTLQREERKMVLGHFLNQVPQEGDIIQEKLFESGIVVQNEDPKKWKKDLLATTAKWDNSSKREVYTKKYPVKFLRETLEEIITE